MLFDIAVYERYHDIALVVDTAVNHAAAAFRGGDAYAVSRESYLAPFRSDDYAVFAVGDAEFSTAVAENAVAFSVVHEPADYLGLRCLAAGIVRYIQVKTRYRGGKYDNDHEKQ